MNPYQKTYIFDLSIFNYYKYTNAFSDIFYLVIFIGSSQDSYSPIESSLVQISERIEKVKYATELQEMASNILKRLINCRVHRVRVSFKIDEKTFDTFVGRKAHIEFIDNPDLIKTLLYMFDHIF